MTEAEEREELLRGIDAMERHLDGYRPYGYCSPASDLSPNSIRLLREEGFVYDATMCADDFTPYWCREHDEDQLARAVHLPSVQRCQDAIDRQKTVSGGETHAWVMTY